MTEQEPANKEGIPSLRHAIICHPRPKKRREKKTQGWQGVDKDIKPLLATKIQPRQILPKETPITPKMTKDQSSC